MKRGTKMNRRRRSDPDEHDKPNGPDRPDKSSEAGWADQPDKPAGGGRWPDRVHLADPADGPGPAETPLRETRPHPPAGLKEPAHSFPVVGVGCSAGGLDPLRRLLGGFKRECGIAFVAIQHLEPSSESHLVELLRRATSLPVEKIEDGMSVEPGRIHVLPPNRYVTLRDHDLRLARPQLSHGKRMPVDYFLRSLAEVQQERGIGVLLSGTGDDGTAGVKALREHGGLVLVQDPDEAEYGDMPRFAMATGMVDYVLRIEHMPETITRYMQKSHLRAPQLPHINDKIVGGILAAVLARTRYDFRCYKRNTIVRRIHRRMGLCQLDNPELYLEHLRQHPHEAEQLRDDLLIGVTGFFREPDSYEELHRTAVRELVDQASEDTVLRVWVPGCATGEEAYSVAIMLQEQMSAQNRSLPLQIFASDIDEVALETARQAIYPASALEDVPVQLRDRYFVREGDHYRCDRRIREPIVFSTQNLISDPPFSRLDLVSCRNVLIYLEGEMQRKVVSALAFALRPGGWLFLGKSDSISGREDLFRLVSKKHRIYRRLATGRPDVTEMPVASLPQVPFKGQALTVAREHLPINLGNVNQQVMLDHFAACIVLINTQGKILHLYGDASPYLMLPPGEPDLDLLKMARGKLGLKLRVALQRAIGDNTVAGVEQVRIDHGGEAFLARATVRPLRLNHVQERLLAVILEKIPMPPPDPRSVRRRMRTWCAPWSRKSATSRRSCNPPTRSSRRATRS
jgi:two-component system CheB/CheR fusion protein